MTSKSIQNAFSSGEISPSLSGRTDLAKYHLGCFTMRNFFVNYRGGGSSRAGLAYVGTCKQPGNLAPPRDIPFQFSNTQGYALEFGDQYMRVKSNGAYVTEVNQTITAITRSNPGVFTYTNSTYTLANGDWVFVTGVVGMTNFNGLTWIVYNVSGSTFSLKDLFGNPVNTSTFNAYISGGNLARIYTVVAPYAAVDLPYLKYTQSADTMSLCCVNFNTLTEYPPYDLKRSGATDWVFTEITFATSISPPTNVAVTPEASTTVSTFYSYVVTAVDRVTGEESVASVAATVENNDISVFAGSNVITWNTVVGASSYNLYRATPSFAVPVPIGVSYGYIGTAFGASFIDTNITSDQTTVPPTHQNPFARGAIDGVTVTNGGSGYDQATIGFSISTSTGSGFAGAALAVNGAFAGVVIENSGEGYVPTDTITITGGTGATATLVIGPQTGTYPSTVAYYSQRRVYASSITQPDTYWMSQPGAFTNFDSSIPTTDADAIVGTPWAQQVNGVEFVVPMPGGLVVLTGKGAWQVNGGNSAAITPADQNATPQAYNGCNDIVVPIVVNYDILYLQSKGSIFRDLSYNFFVNIYTGTDLTILSNQLFDNHTFTQWCWSEEPYKIAWAVRDDGVVLSLTYLKEQDVYAWARHDTNGLFQGVCSITEPPVDAVYYIVKRYVRGQWMYYSERADDRSWENIEDCYCVDSGLRWPMATPASTLTAASATGSANITGVASITGGNGYTSPVITAVDPTGSGSGATFSATLSGGSIVSITPLTSGSGYSFETTIVIDDPNGSGAKFYPLITNNVVFTSSANVFSAGNVGQVIRMGGGVATVTSYLSATQVIANITVPITSVIPNDPTFMPEPAISGSWTITPTTSVVSGLNHLEGLEVAILADGGVVANQTVTNGSITLPNAASAIVIGLPFVCQLQTTYLDPPGQQDTPQSKRKNIYSVAVRVQGSRGISVGANQPDASSEPNGATLPWAGLTPVKERNALVTAGQSIPLYTGDYFINIEGGWNEYGQVAVEQTYPLPANILSVVTYFRMGDTSG